METTTFKDFMLRVQLETRKSLRENGLKKIFKDNTIYLKKTVDSRIQLLVANEEGTLKEVFVTVQVKRWILAMVHQDVLRSNLSNEDIALIEQVRAFAETKAKERLQAVFQLEGTIGENFELEKRMLKTFKDKFWTREDYYGYFVMKELIKRPIKEFSTSNLTNLLDSDIEDYAEDSSEDFVLCKPIAKKREKVTPDNTTTDTTTVKPNKKRKSSDKAELPTKKPKTTDPSPSNTGNKKRPLPNSSTETTTPKRKKAKKVIPKQPLRRSSRLNK